MPSTNALLATDVVDEVRRRVQQDIHGHRGRKDDPLYRVRNILRAGVENLTDRQRARLEAAWVADERHLPVQVAYLCAQQVRSAYHQDTLADGRAIATKVLDSFATCPVPEVARLGRTLKQWRSEFLGYFDTNRASNGGTEAVQCRRRHWKPYADVWIMPIPESRDLVDCGLTGWLSA